MIRVVAWIWVVLGILYIAARSARITWHWHPILKGRPFGYERFPSKGWVVVWGRVTVAKHVGRRL